MTPKKYNIAKPEKYVDKQGQEKTYWANVGTMTIFVKQDGTNSILIEIPAIGLKASAFEIQPKPAPIQPKDIPIVQDNPEPTQEPNNNGFPF